MLNRERIQKQTEHDLQFLDDRWDSALVGFIESGRNGGVIAPCYNYQKAKLHLINIGVKKADVTKRLQYMCSSPAIILNTYKAAKLREIIKKDKLVTLEHLSKAIIGIASTRFINIGVIYSKNWVDLELNRGIVENCLEDHIIPINLGEKSPWFLTTINYEND